MALEPLNLEGRKPLRVRSPQFFPTSLSINKKPMDGRLSSMQNCEAILQSRKKATDGFFSGQAQGTLSFLPCQKVTSHGRRLCACRIAQRFCNPGKKPRMDFFRAGSGNGCCFLPKRKEPRRDFLYATYAAMEPL